MATRPVKVTIDGEEFVSKAADSADKSMAGFAGKVPGYAKVVAGLAVAYGVVSAAVNAVKDFVVDSFAAFDAYSASQNKMAAQSKLTGVSMQELEKGAKRARDEFGLGAVVANDAATTVAKYASRAGDASKQNELLAAALNLGAASGLDAAASMDALEQGLRGQDEGFDKLLGKNPSAIWKEYADANGLAVGKMTDAQKRMAELTAVVEAGNRVGDTYNERLKTGAGQQELMNNRMENAKVAFGEALQPVRMLVIGGLSKLIEIGTPVVVLLAKMANTAGTLLGVAFQDLRESVANVAIVFGKLTGNKDMQTWGEEQAAAANAAKLSIYAMATATKAATTTVTEHSTAVKASTAVAETESKKQDAAWQKYLKEYEAGIKRINDAYEAYLKLLPKLQPALEASMQTVHIEGQNRALKASKDAADAAMKALRDGAEPLPALIGSSTGALSDMGTKLGDAADAVLVVGENFGGLDDDAKKVLTSVKNIGTSMGDLAKNGLSFAGVTGLIGGVASIVSGMMAADAERRRLLRENNTQLQRLREEGISLSTKVSGDKMSRIFQALSGADLSSQYFVSKERSVLEQLAKFGVTVRDLEAVANEYGIQNVAKDGQIQNFVALRQLIEVLKLGGGVRVGQSFSDQLQFFRDSQRANGNDGVGGIQGLIDFLRNVGGVSALNGIDVMSDPAGAANALRAIFTSLNNAEGIDPARIGRLTGTQFSSILLEIIDSLRSAGGGSTGSSSTGGDGTGATGPTITSGGVIVPTKTLSDVLDGVVAQTTALAAYHVKHLDLATAHLNEAKTQTVILSDIADSVRPLRDGGITSIADRGLEAERLSLAAERGIGASF
jgi:hypothetical protein